MQVSLFKHIDGLKFDDPEAIILSGTAGGDYNAMYDAYIAPALFWTGAGKTYNIELLEVCEVPIQAIEDADPIYIKVLASGGARYYYVNSIDRLAQKAVLYITLDVFATFYDKAKLNSDSLIITKSTLRLAPNRLIPIAEEKTPISVSSYTKEAIAANDGVVFIIKAKFQTARQISTQAFVTRLAAITVNSPDTGTTWKEHLENIYTNIQNIYEVLPNGAAPQGALPCQIESVYLLPSNFFNIQLILNQFIYVDQHGDKQKMEMYWVTKKTENEFTYYLNDVTTPTNKIIIGKNEIQLPPYRNVPYIKIKPIYNYSDFDLILEVENMKPQSIKQYFECETANTTQETSIQKMSRIFGYILNSKSAISNAVIGAYTGMATGNVVGAAVSAGSAIGSAGDSIASDVLAKMTRGDMPATNFENQCFDVFLNLNGGLNSGYIYQQYYAGLSQSLLSLKRVGIEWFNQVNNLEYLLSVNTPPLITGARRYIEAQVKVEGLAISEAQALADLLANGVELIKGD